MTNNIFREIYAESVIDYFIYMEWMVVHVYMCMCRIYLTTISVTNLNCKHEL